MTATYTGLDHKVYPAPPLSKGPVSGLQTRCGGHSSPLRRRGRTRATHAFDNSENQPRTSYIALPLSPSPPVTLYYTYILPLSPVTAFLVHIFPQVANTASYVSSLQTLSQPVLSLLSVLPLPCHRNCSVIRV